MMPTHAQSYMEKTFKLLMIASLRGLKQKEQIGELLRAGFAAPEIAEILGSTPNAINARIGELRKESKKVK